MSETEYGILKSLTDHLNAHDLDSVYGLVDENYCEYLNGVLVKSGLAATRAADQFVYDTVPDYRREVDQLYADDDGGAMFWRFCGTGPNGPFEMSVASNYRFKDGKVVECWLYGDPTAYADALGLSG
jgi:ketosteroid isomerase-like protein